MDQYDATKQHTPSGRLHYIFYVDGEQAKRIGSNTCLTHTGIEYNTDVKFKNGLRNCQQSRIPEYGEYKWERPFKLRNDIPKLPDILFNMICKLEPHAPTEYEQNAPYDNIMV